VAELRLGTLNKLECAAINMSDKAPPPLPKYEAVARGPKAKGFFVAALILVVVGVPLLVVVGAMGGSAIKAFNKGRDRALGKLAADVVRNIDEMQEVMRDRPGEELPEKWRSLPGSSVVLGGDTPQDYMNRRFGGGSLTVAGREGASATVIILPDGRRFGPPEVISKGFRIGLPDGWTAHREEKSVVHLNPSRQKMVQVMFRDVHRGDEGRVQMAWINHCREELSQHAKHTRRVGEWETPHAKFYRIDASGGEGGGGRGDESGGWVSEFHFTTTPGRAWLVRTVEGGHGDHDKSEGENDEIRAMLQSFQPL
jgi:hypothetical protein